MSSHLYLRNYEQSYNSIFSIPYKWKGLINICIVCLVLFLVEEVLQNMYCISNIIEYIIIEVSQNTNLYIFCDTCLYWDIHYNMFRLYIQRHLVLKFIHRHFLYVQK